MIPLQFSPTPDKRFLSQAVPVNNKGRVVLQCTKGNYYMDILASVDGVTYTSIGTVNVTDSQILAVEGLVNGMTLKIRCSANAKVYAAS